MARRATGIHDHPGYKTGVIPARPADYARIIRLPVRAAPPHPVSADFLAGVPSWILGGNDRFGTCGPVSLANYVRLTWWYLTGELITVSNDAIFDLYRRSGNPDFDPATGAGDNGVEMPVMLDALLKDGLTITHANGNTETIFPLCYARVDVAGAGGLDTLRSVTSFAGGAILAADLETAQQGQTDAQPPVWDYRASGEWGGHAFAGGAYTSTDQPGQVDESVVSWAMRVGTTDAFMRQQLMEAYAVIFRVLWDHPAFQAGVDRAVLAAYYQEATGRTIPIPPAPPPEPPPGPPGPPAPVPPAPVPENVSAADRALWRTAQPWAGRRHVGEGKQVAGALKTWAGAKGMYGGS